MKNLAIPTDGPIIHVALRPDLTINVDHLTYLHASPHHPGWTTIGLAGGHTLHVDMTPDQVQEAICNAALTLDNLRQDDPDTGIHSDNPSRI